MPSVTSIPAPRRQRRGRERRDTIIEATLVILEAEGLEGITHRRVADAAGVPLAATTYYFAGKDDLIQAAMGRLVDREAAVFRRLAEDVTSAGAMTIDEGVEALVEYHRHLLRERRPALFAEFELLLRMARTAPGTPEFGGWPRAFRAVAEAALEALGAADPRRDAQALVALVHGLVLHALTATDPAAFADEVMTPVLRAWFTQVLAAGPAVPA